MNMNNVKNGLSGRHRTHLVSTFLAGGLLCLSLAGLCAAEEAGDKETQSESSAALALLETLDPFYKQHRVVDGLLIVSSEKVSKYAIDEVEHLVRKMLGKRPDILAELAKRNYLGVMAYTEMTTDIPESRNMGPWWDMRARGLSGRLITCAEENVLMFKGDPWAGENIFIHELSHGIHHVLLSMDKTFSPRIRAVCKNAQESGRFRGYGLDDKGEPLEFFAEGVQAYFNCNGAIRPKGAGKNPSLEALDANGEHLCHIRTREQLQKHLPELAGLIDEAYGHNPWTYVPVAKRLDQPHLRGFDPAKAPVFRWPKKVVEAFNRIEAEKKAEKARVEKKAK